MRGIHRYWWSRNQLLLRNLPVVLDLMAGAGVRTMLLKGIPLALRYYGDVGLRPMADFDVLVPTADADRAVDALERNGWRINEPVRVFRSDGTVDTFAHPGVGFVASDRSQCDLHWHMMHDCCWDGADEGAWARAAVLDHNGRTFEVPSPTDMLFHVIVHGAAYNKIAPIRWIADAAQILRTAAAEIDWRLLCSEAERRLLTVVVREGLARVAAVAGVEPPRDVTRRLSAVRVCRAELREYRRRLVDQDYRYTVTGRWCELSRQYGDRGLARRLARVPSFMQQIWSVDSKLGLPATLAFRIVPAWIGRVVRGGPALTT
jgi:hypothetical protein